MRSKAAKIFSAMTVGVLLTGTLLTGISASAATGPKFIYTFDDLATGSNAFDSKIVEKIMPESGLGVDFNAKINADSSKNKLETGKEGSSKVATDWGKSLEVNIGEWKIGAPMWEYMWLNIPADAQDWSSYKQFGFYWNNQRCLADSQAGIIMMFEDGDGELWGWKANVNVQDCWTYTLFGEEGQLTLEKAASAWQGFGHENWYGGYITIVLDKANFERKSDNEKKNGNGVFDLNKITRVQVHISVVGATGVSREGDIMYFDDFFLAKQVRTSGDKYYADGMVINKRNDDKIEAGTNPPEPTPSTSSETKTPVSSAARPSPSSEAASPSEVTGSAASSETAAVSSEPPQESIVSEVSSNEAVSSSALEEDDGGGGFWIWIVVAVVVVLAGAGVGVFFIIKNKQTPKA